MGLGDHVTCGRVRSCDLWACGHLTCGRVRSCVRVRSCDLWACEIM